MFRYGYCALATHMTGIGADMTLETFKAANWDPAFRDLLERLR